MATQLFGALRALFLAFFFYRSEGYRCPGKLFGAFVFFYLRHWQIHNGGFGRHSPCWCLDLARGAFWSLGGLFLIFFSSRQKVTLGVPSDARTARSRRRTSSRSLSLWVRPLTTFIQASPSLLRLSPSRLRTLFRS